MTPISKHISELLKTIGLDTHEDSNRVLPPAILRIPTILRITKHRPERFVNLHIGTIFITGERLKLNVAGRQKWYSLADPNLFNELLEDLKIATCYQLTRPEPENAAEFASRFP